MYRASALGGGKWLGYGVTEARLDTLIDGQRLLLKATAQRKARLPESEKVPRPTDSRQKKVVKATDAGVLQAFFGQIG